MQHLEHPYKAQINQYRQLIRSLNPKIEEEIKWSAPSFKFTEHFATLKLYPVKQLQIILHRGAKVKTDNKQMLLTDVHGLCKWAAADRCVITLKTIEQAEKFAPEIGIIIKQWIEQL